MGYAQHGIMNGLNFSQGHYQDPAQALQQSLGAGGMFAQTLKQMGQDDINNARLSREQEEFQWRKDDRDRVENERNNAVGLQQALIANRNTALAESENSAFDAAAAKSGGKDFFIDPSNAKYGNLSTNASVLEGLKAKALDPKYKDNADVQNFLNAMNGEGGFDNQFNGDYSASSKAAMLHGVNKALGLSDADAVKQTSLALGSGSEGLVSDTIKANSKLNTFDHDFNLGVQHDPTLRKSQLDIVGDYIAANPNTAGKDSNVLKAWQDLDGAQTSAIAAKKKEIEALQMQAASAEQQNALHAAELQLKALDSRQQMQMAKLKGVAGFNNVTSDSAGNTENAIDYSKQYQTLANAAIQNTINKYGAAALTEKNHPVMEQLNDYGQKMIAAGVRPDVIALRLRGMVTTDGTDSDKKDILKLKGDGSILGAIPESDKIQATDFGLSKKTKLDPQVAQQMYAMQMNGEQAKLDVIKGMLKAGDGTVDAINARLANMQRDPKQAYMAEAAQLGKNIAIDNGWGAPDQIVKTKSSLIGSEGSGNIGNGSTGTTLQSKVANGTYADAFKDAKDIKGLSPDQMKYNSLKLPDTFNGMPDDQKKSMLRDISYSVINQAEGTKANPYATYKDSLGKLTTGTGVLVSGFEKSALGGVKYDPTNLQHRAALDAYQVKVKNDAINSATKQAHELGFSSDAIPILASVNYQLGNGWDDKFKQTYSLLKDHKYDEAIAKIKNSDWHDQTSNRADAFIAAIKQQKDFRNSGKLDNVDTFYANKNSNSPQINMIHALQSGVAPKTADDLISTGYSSAINNVPLVRQQAEQAKDDYGYYAAQREQKQNLFNQHLQDDGKADFQVNAIKQAGMQKQYNAAKSPAERLKAIAEAQRKLAEESSGGSRSLIGF